MGRDCKPLEQHDNGYDDFEREGKAKVAMSWTLGIIFIVLTCLIWSTASVLVQYIYTDHNFNQPFFVTFFGGSLVSFFVPGHLAYSALGLLQSSSRGTSNRGEGQHLDPSSGGNFGSLNGAAVSEVESPLEMTMQPNGGGGDHRGVKVVDHVYAAKVGFWLCPLWFFSQLCYNFSLMRTSVTSSMIIAQLASPFAFAFSVALGYERLTAVKMCGMIVSFVGVVAVGLGDERDEEGEGAHDTVWGDVAAIGCAALIGGYVTTLRVMVPSDDEVDMPLILGYMGVFNIIMFMPVLLVLMLIPGIQPMAGLSLTILGLITVKAMLDNVTSELLWARAVVLTTPTVATVGLALTVPIAFVADLFLHGTIPKPPAICGAALVVGGFVLVACKKDTKTLSKDDADSVLLRSDSVASRP